MALTYKEKMLVTAAISMGLDRAEGHWDKVGQEMIKKAMAFEAAMIRADESVKPSQIPGHPMVSDGTPKVDEFIAMVVDMRKSSERLKTKVNSPVIKDGFQRVYFETSALLPAISVVTSLENGVVTEYLGDGALALFQVNKDDREETIREANRVARNCIEDMRNLINIELDNRYQLPSIDLGVGLSISKAMVTLVGALDNLHPKAIGECVWEATKLSGETNVVMVSSTLRKQWPQSKGGKMTFIHRTVRGVDGYRLSQT